MHRLAIKERQRNLDAERMERARAEANAVTTGVAETVSLQEARGQVFAHPVQKRGERAKPVRHLTALEVMGGKRQLDEGQRAAGEKWAGLYRVIHMGGVRSGLDFSVKGGDHPTDVFVRAWREMHKARWALNFDPALIAVCDETCGRDVTLYDQSRTDDGKPLSQMRRAKREKLVEALEMLRVFWRL